jgi:hypothetical protein
MSYLSAHSRTDLPQGSPAAPGRSSWRLRDRARTAIIRETDSGLLIPPQGCKIRRAESSTSVGAKRLVFVASIAIGGSTISRGAARSFQSSTKGPAVCKPLSTADGDLGNSTFGMIRSFQGPAIILEPCKSFWVEVSLKMLGVDLESRSAALCTCAFCNGAFRPNSSFRGIVARALSAYQHRCPFTSRYDQCSLRLIGSSRIHAVDSALAGPMVRPIAATIAASTHTVRITYTAPAHLGVARFQYG